MRRLFTGAFDPTGRFPHLRLSHGLAGEAPNLASLGSLRVAHTGPPAPGTAPLVLLDGFLSNRRELAASLGRCSPEPGEALLALAYRRWGPGILERLRGDFALLVWDEVNGEGLLARDRLGMRCVYLHDGGGPLLRFAGEIRHLIAAMGSRPAPDPVSVAHWVAISSRPGPHTLYEGVRRLEPGSMLLLDRRGHRIKRYWAPSYAEPSRRSRRELSRELSAGLSKAVTERLPRQGRTSVLMSGGLDSASVAALAARAAPGRVLAHSGLFPGLAEVDESALIELLRARLGLGGASASVRPGGLLASVLEHQRAWEVPLLGWGDFWTLPLLRRAAREGVSVTLGGDGGDELFGARAYLIADQLRAGHAARAMGLTGRLPGAGRHPSRRQRLRILASLGVGGALGPRLHAGLERIAPGARAPRWLTPPTARDLLRSDDPHAWKRTGTPRWWAHPAHGLTVAIEEAGVLEHQRQRATLAGLEARLPMLDPDLILLALGHSPSESFDPELNRPLLREAMAGLLPDRVRLRSEKAWFDSLIVACLTGADMPLIHALLMGSASESRAFIDGEQIARAYDSLTAARGVERFHAMHLIWRALTIECWLRAQADPDESTLPHAAEISSPQVELRSLGEGDTARAASTPSYVFPP